MFSSTARGRSILRLRSRTGIEGTPARAFRWGGGVRPTEDVQYALGGVQRHPPHGLFGEGGRVRGEDDLLHREKGMTFARRLRLVHVDAGPGEMSGAQRLDQGVLLDHPAAGS